MKKRLICTMGILACGSAAFAVTFTGDVVADFAAADVTVLDLHNDVGLPNNAPAGTISGWDLSSVQFLLDAAADELNIGLDFRSFAGDADGDGLDGITSLWLATNGGIDMGGMAQTEAICIAFDFDQDGDYEIIAGYGAVDNVYRVSYFTGSPLLPAFGFGGLAPHDGGHAWGPDLEIALSDISTLDTLDPLCFDFLMFAGSYQDDGIGEDLLAGEACWPPVQATDPVRLDLLKAQPNPFNPVTTLTVDMAATGEVTLAVYNVKGQLVRTMLDGMLSAGRHELTFDGSGLPSGVYLAQLQTGSGRQTTRMILAK